MNISNVYTAGDSVIEGDVTWKECNELPPNYQFSDTGLVRKFISRTEYVFVVPRINDYPMLSINGKQHLFHRIIASLFVEVPQSSYQEMSPSTLSVIHKDGDICNNCANNLEWSVPGLLKKSGIDLTKKWIICKETHKLYSSVSCASFVFGIPREAIADSLKLGKPVCGLHFYLDHPDGSFTVEDVIQMTTAQAKELAFDADSLQDFHKNIETFS